jgi:hypothetical protein
MKKIHALLIGYIVAQIVSFNLVANAYSGEEPKAEPSFYSQARECRVKTDTNCIVLKRNHPSLPSTIAIIRFIDEGEFCVKNNLPGQQGTRCEGYWPFESPIINADLKDASNTPRHDR